MSSIDSLRILIAVAGSSTSTSGTTDCKGYNSLTFSGLYNHASLANATVKLYFSSDNVTFATFASDDIILANGVSHKITTPIVSRYFYFTIQNTDGVAMTNTKLYFEAHKTAHENIDVNLDSADIVTVANPFNLEATQLDVKTSLQLLDNAVDGNYLNTNINLAGVDCAVSSGPLGSAVQRVCVASDDININAIKNAVELLDNAVDGAYLNTNMNIAGGDVDGSSGALSSKTQRVCVATDDVNLSAIKNAVELLDNSVDGNYLNINMNIAGTDVSSGSGALSGQTQRVCVASDDINLSAIKTSVELLDNSVDGNYLNINMNLAGTDCAVSSGPLGSAVQRVCVASDDINLTAIKTAVELIDNSVGTDGATGPVSCLSVGGTEAGGNIQELLVDSNGRLQVDVVSGTVTATVALPTGASTSAHQATHNTHLTNILTQVSQGSNGPRGGATLEDNQSKVATNVSAVIDLGDGSSSSAEVFNCIQLSGKSTTSTFTFFIQYSLDNVNWWGTDGLEPDLTQIGSDYTFSITRSHIAHRYLRLYYKTAGSNVYIHYSTAHL